MKNIFIAGSSGFTGRNLNERLQGKYKIFAPSHKDLDLLEADRVRDYVRKNKIGVIINCANVGGGRDTVGLRDVVQTNLRIFFNIVRCAERVEKIIQFGSGAEYDKSRDLKKVKEEEFDKRIPKDDYGFYKYVCSKYIQSWSSYAKFSRSELSEFTGPAARHPLVVPGQLTDPNVTPRGYLTRVTRFLKQRSANLENFALLRSKSVSSYASPIFSKKSRIICLRLFGVYGKYEDYRYKFISNSIVKNLLHLPIVINQNVIFDYLYIDDLVRIVGNFINNRYNGYNSYNDYNIASGKQVSLFQIARTINKISDYRSRISIVNKGMNLEYTADNRRLLKELGNFRFTPIEEGMKKLRKYYQGILHTIDRGEIEKDELRKYCKTR